MARSFPGTAYLYKESAVVSAEPITLACWFYATSTSTATTMVCTNQLASIAVRNGFEIRTNTSDQVQFRSHASNTSFRTANTSNTFSPGTWNFAAGKSGSTASRYAYLNGTLSAENTSTVSRSASPDTVSIGAERYNSGASADAYWDGRIANACVWNVELTTAELDSLYQSGVGADPRSIRPDALVAFWPLLDSDGDADWWGQYNMTASGSPSYAAHPPVLMKSRPRYVVTGGGGGGGGFQPAWARYTNSIIGAGVAG